MIKDQSFGIIPYIVENKQIKYLIIHHQKGHWAFPKGHKEVGESDLETAKRELKEETGLSITKLWQQTFSEKYSFVDPKKGEIDKIVTYYLGEAKTTRVKIQQAEVQEYAWVNFQDAQDYLTFPEAKALLKKVDTFLSQKLKNDETS